MVHILTYNLYFYVYYLQWFEVSTKSCRNKLHIIEEFIVCEIKKKVDAYKSGFDAHNHAFRHKYI